jgi:benzoyl-CoA reductase subunit D
MPSSTALRPEPRESAMTTTVGIDVGSSAVKVAVIDSPLGSGRVREGAELLAHHTVRIRRRDQRTVIRKAYEQALLDAGLSEQEIDYVATTGEGELVDFRLGHFYSMTAHARGASWLVPETRSVLDVGALHARGIKLDAESKVLGYRMTSQCASGSGQFLENIARYLGVTLEEVGPLSMLAPEGAKISSICAVLAETDVINMVSRGTSLESILRGIHESMAGRFAKLLRKLKVRDGVVLMTGGLANDSGLVACTQQSLEALGLDDIDVRTHPLSMQAGAIGAALWGGYRYEKLSERSLLEAMKTGDEAHL